MPLFHLNRKLLKNLDQVQKKIDNLVAFEMERRAEFDRRHQFFTNIRWWFYEWNKILPNGRVPEIPDNMRIPLHPFEALPDFYALMLLYLLLEIENDAADTARGWGLDRARNLLKEYGWSNER
ncbi:MAG: hypothetical protein WA109_00875 [Bellilinea sp.]